MTRAWRTYMYRTNGWVAASRVCESKKKKNYRSIARCIVSVRAIEPPDSVI
jgi:hypothetical protein